MCVCLVLIDDVDQLFRFFFRVTRFVRSVNRYFRLFEQSFFRFFFAGPLRRAAAAALNIF